MMDDRAKGQTKKLKESGNDRWLLKFEIEESEIKGCDPSLYNFVCDIC